jgi:hypothetical protein
VELMVRVVMLDVDNCLDTVEAVVVDTARSAVVSD